MQTDTPSADGVFVTHQARDAPEFQISRHHSGFVKLKLRRQQRRRRHVRSLKDLLSSTDSNKLQVQPETRSAPFTGRAPLTDTQSSSARSGFVFHIFPRLGAGHEYASCYFCTTSCIICDAWNRTIRRREHNQSTTSCFSLSSCV